MLSSLSTVDAIVVVILLLFLVVASMYSSRKKKTTEDYFRFTHDEMPFYSRQYQRLREASDAITPGLEAVYNVAWFNLTLHYPLILAALDPTDPPKVIDRKMRVVATFLDILLARRVVNYLTLGDPKWGDVMRSSVR